MWIDVCFVILGLGYFNKARYLQILLEVHKKRTLNLFTVQRRRKKAFLHRASACFRKDISRFFSVPPLLFSSEKGNVSDPHLLLGLTAEVYHLSNKESVMISSYKLVRAYKSIQFKNQKVQNCLICLLRTAEYFPLASFFGHLFLYSRMPLWLMLGMNMWSPALHLLVGMCFVQ